MSGDIVIVGGGPAGLVCAASIVAHAPALRSRVHVIEREKYPRDKLCAGGVGDRGWRYLERLGIAPDVPEVRISAIRLTTSLATMEGRPDVPIGRVIRRLQFDHALADQVRALGIRLSEGTAVKRLEDSRDGVTVETSSGTLEAAVVVGADGVGSVVRRSMGLHAGGLRAAVLEVDSPAGEGDPARDTLHFDARWPDLPGYIWDFPTVVDGEPLMCRGIYVLRARSGLVSGLEPESGETDLAQRLGAYMADKGVDLSQCRKKRFAERGWEPASRVVMGRRLLVGEAAGVDPISGEGIAQAVESGFNLGRFLSAGRFEVERLQRWQHGFSRSRLGWDLTIRRQLLRATYGQDRLRIERALAGNDALLEAGCRHWAGTPQRSLALAGAGLRGLWGLARGTP